MIRVFKFYDTFCDNCGNWYGASKLPPRTTNQNDAIKEMKKNGWKFKNGKTLCDKC